MSFKIFTTDDNKFAVKKLAEDGSSLGIAHPGFATEAEAQAFVDAGGELATPEPVIPQVSDETPTEPVAAPSAPDEVPAESNPAGEEKKSDEVATDSGVLPESGEVSPEAETVVA